MLAVVLSVFVGYAFKNGTQCYAVNGKSTGTGLQLTFAVEKQIRFIRVLYTEKSFAESPVYVQSPFRFGNMRHDGIYVPSPEEKTAVEQFLSSKQGQDLSQASLKFDGEIRWRSLIKDAIAFILMYVVLLIVARWISNALPRRDFSSDK